MKRMTHLFAVALVTLTTSLSFAGLSVLENEEIRDGSIKLSFNLRAVDGSVLSFLTKAASDAGSLALLPPEKNADQSLCAKMNVNIITSLTDITIRLIQDSSNQAPALLPQEIAIIQKVPRCEMYRQSLSSVANMLAIGNPNVQKSQELKKISLVKIDKKTSVIELITESGAKAQMQIASLPKRVEEMGDLTQMQVLAASSGQLLGLKIQHLGLDNSPFPPSQTRRTESCTISYTRTVCDQFNRNCRIENITETGTREVIVDTTFNMKSYDVSLTNAQNQEVFSGTISDGEFVSKDHAGPCMRSSIGF